MKYVYKRGNKYHYWRRVPDEFKHLDGRVFVKKSLRTDSLEIAEKRAQMINDATEALWYSGRKVASGDQMAKYNAAVKLALQQGVQYVPLETLAKGRIEDIVDRVRIAEKGGPDNKALSSAVLGTVKKPGLTILQAWDKFLDLSKDKLRGKTLEQKKKWKNPRQRAVNVFVEVCGDLNLEDIGRNEALDLRDMWSVRMDEEGIKPDTANKSMRHVSQVYTKINDFLRLDLNPGVFKDLSFSEVAEENRVPYDRVFVAKHLVNQNALTTLNPQARMIVWAFASTGAGVSELLGLLPEEIRLDADIPYVQFQSNEVRGHEKTLYRKRQIPLVGSALEAFKAFPNGFTDYQGRVNSCSTAIGKYLRENGLRPSNEHSLYSLRHTFQDALTAAEAPERVQADLMGHKFTRERYGFGSSLDQKYKWIQHAAFSV